MDLAHHFEPAGLAQLRRRLLHELHRPRHGHFGAVVGRRAEEHVHHAVFQSLELLVGRHHFGAADIVHRHLALELLVDELLEGEKAFAEVVVGGPRRDAAERDRLLRENGAAYRERGKREGRLTEPSECDAFHERSPLRASLSAENLAVKRKDKTIIAA
jgi:hypothetical protein